MVFTPLNILCLTFEQFLLSDELLLLFSNNCCILMSPHTIIDVVSVSVGEDCSYLDECLIENERGPRDRQSFWLGARDVRINFHIFD